MQLIRNISELRSRHENCVATIGNFDGFHLGHQTVLKQLRSRADELSLPMAVLVFEPQPLEFFDPDNAPSRLTRWREKYQLLRDHGVDKMICLRFNASLASLTAEDFVQDLLHQKLAVKHLVIGDDFRFGQGRKGDYDLLCKFGKKLDFNVERSETFLIEDERVSSSQIRAMLEAGNLNRATQFLGRHYSISGRVVHGNKQGRTLGFPTANIELQRMKTALKGIFVGQVQLDDHSKHPAVTYIGTKPTLGGTRSLLEAHLFDYAGDLYGKYIKVEFLRKLRDDEKFDSFDLLKEQIATDARMARDYFLDNG